MRLQCLIGLALLVGSAHAAQTDEKKLPTPAKHRIDFAKDVQPILADRCGSCHGVDKQRGGLRLDQKGAAFQGGDSGPAFRTGKSEQSLLIRYVAGLDEDMVMPPSGPRLTPLQVGVLRAWIDQGADWPDTAIADKKTEVWWSLRPLSKPSVPTVSSDRFPIRNPIDSFILAKLQEQKLAPSNEADRRTLIRRLYFDLIGLPPTAEDSDAFVASTSPTAYEDLVDRLLTSSHYGERWARHWLDVVHFGETHGYDKDKPRPHAWPYRDYVIRAFNEDRPYGRFIEEQIAGDVLYPGTPDGIEALGFIAAGPWDFIGHVEVPESRTDGKITRHLDRDDMVATTMGVFVSSTASCAQCHNHKFDPITMEDYYSLQAVFAAVDRADRRYHVDPAVMAKREALERKQQDLEYLVKQLENKAVVTESKELAELDRQIRLAGQPMVRRPEYGYHSAVAKDPATIKWVQVDLGLIAPIERIELTGCYDDFNNIGAGFGFPVRYRVEISLDPTFSPGASVVMDRAAQDVTNPGTTPVPIAVGGKQGRYVRVTALKLAPRQNDYNFALAELSVFDTAGKNIALGKTVTAADSIEALPRWSKQNLVDGIANLAGGGNPLAALKEQRIKLLAKLADPKIQASLETTHAELEAVQKDLAKLPAAQVVYAGTIHRGSGAFAGTGNNGGQPRPIHILARGDVKRPGAEVGPGALSALAGLPSRFALPTGHTEGERRAALAKWLSDQKNPLTWRSIVNRIWLYHFGRGIVETPNDFGRMGQSPSHPELLDWLAAEFRDGGQSLKSLHRLIVASSTYRQASTHRPEAAQIDADNQYYWRMNRRRLEAEAVRDGILSVSGKLDLKMGGPSYQDFVVKHPEHSPHYKYELHDPEDPATHRRSVYRFIVRSQQQPFMMALDCADPSLVTEKRNQTITPQQSLAMLNNSLTLAMAKHFAARVQKLAAEPKDQAVAAYRIALGRSPTAPELAALRAYCQEHGLANLCRIVMNLNEFVFVD